MPHKDNIENKHEQIGLAINRAKRRMYKAHREGKPLSEAKQNFFAEIDSAIQEQDIESPGRKKATEEKAEPRAEKNEGLDRATLRERARAIIDNPATKSGTRFHVEEILEAEKWEDLAEMLDSIDKGWSYNRVLARNDPRTLTSEQIEQVCKELASHIEDYHLVGYMFALLEHISAAAQTMDVETIIYDAQRYFMTYNAHGANEAAKHLRISALVAPGQK